MGSWIFMDIHGDIHHISRWVSFYPSLNDKAAWSLRFNSCLETLWAPPAAHRTELQLPELCVLGCDPHTFEIRECFPIWMQLRFLKGLPGIIEDPCVFLVTVVQILIPHSRVWAKAPPSPWGLKEMQANRKMWTKRYSAASKIFIHDLQVSRSSSNGGHGSTKTEHHGSFQAQPKTWIQVHWEWLLLSLIFGLILFPQD